MQSACAVLYCHLWPVWLYHIFPHYLINGTIFGKKFIEHKMCVLVFSTTFFWNISHSTKNSARYIGLHVKCPLLLSDFNETNFLDRVSKKYSTIKFDENPSSGSQVISMRTDGETDMKKLIVAFCNFAKAPNKNVTRCYKYSKSCSTIPLALQKQLRVFHISKFPQYFNVMKINLANHEVLHANGQICRS
jgi:hypothetical protein